MFSIEFIAGYGHDATKSKLERPELRIPIHAKCYLLIGVLFSPTAVLATDCYQVRLKNGDLLSGTLQNQTRQLLLAPQNQTGIPAGTKEVLLETSYAGLLKINIAAIQSVTSSDCAAIATAVVKDTQHATAPQYQAVRTAAAEPAPAARTLPITVNNNIEIDTEPKPWSLQLDLSAATRAGKEQSKSYSLNERFEYRTGDWRHTLDAYYDYETKEAARKTHKYGLNPGLDYFYSPQLFWRLNADYAYNYLASDYKNIDINTGPGYAVWQQGPTRLDLVLLVGRKQAYFREDELLSLLLNFQSPLGYNTASLAWDFSYQWSGTMLEVYSEGNWLEVLSQPLSLLDFERELSTEAGLRYALTDKIRISWSWQYNRTDLSLLLPQLPRTSLDLSDSKQKISIGAAF